jgi:hypothetical protein
VHVGGRAAALARVFRIDESTCTMSHAVGFGRSRVRGRDGLIFCRARTTAALPITAGPPDPSRSGRLGLVRDPLRQPR